ncbi:SGNH/GDSL hydrolase family protein [Lacticaseibacillus porcinae]|uniref:SGNH/GDSL hydrolase family protein n=1 Tax=Lacticaseibacillus porcinae TaxID=1123687 RepID=UPI000F79DE1C|nr:SGNH/GDSL hydrolase family protein [Lacticaseibacillus porcinae]
MKKIGLFFAALLALVALGMIIFFGRQHQADQFAAQKASHAALVAKQAANSSSAVSSSTTTHKTNKVNQKVGHDQSLKYVALGDSLAAGDYTSKENMAYQYVFTRYLKDTLGYKATLDGFWQAGATITSIAQPNYDKVVAMAPNLITIELGTNEQDQTNPNYADATTFQTNLANLVAGFKSDLPKTKLILLTTWKADTSTSYNHAIKAVGTQYTVPVVDISKVYEKSSNIAQSGAKSWAGSGDGYHPNDAGNQAIADLLAKQADQFYVH